MKKKIKIKNPFAYILSNRLFAKRIVKPKKGRGSYSRKGVNSSL